MKKNYKRKIIFLSAAIVFLLLTLSLLIYFGTKKDFSVSSDSSQKTVNVSSSDNPDKSLSELISSNKNLSKFESLLKRNALFISLDGQDSYTVFAVNNSGLDAMTEQEKELFKDETGNEFQKNILNYQIVKGIYKPENLTEGLKLKTTEDSEIIVKNRDNDIYIIDMKGNESHVVKSGLLANNGSLYITDKLLLPQ